MHVVLVSWYQWTIIVWVHLSLVPVNMDAVHNSTFSTLNVAFQLRVKLLPVLIPILWRHLHFLCECLCCWWNIDVDWTNCCVLWACYYKVHLFPLTRAVAVGSSVPRALTHGQLRSWCRVTDGGCVHVERGARPTFFTNLSHHRLPSGLRTDSTDFTTGPFLLSISVFMFSFLH